MLPEDVEMKQELVMMSPPASDSGSGSPPQFSPYCVDSEPGSPLLDHEQVKVGIHLLTIIAAKQTVRTDIPIIFL